ncbi:PAS domain-containing protein [Halobellus sp. Atlit-31R]|nr:PAS domain-containing protein [Halobellus sp. Atlit-31R]
MGTRQLTAGVRPGDTDEEASLRQRLDFWQQMFDTVVEAFPEPVVVVDDNGIITHWNERMASLIGFTREEAVGEQAYDVFQTEGESETLAEEVARTGEVVREDDIRSGTNADGEPWHIRAAAFPLTDSNGNVFGAFEITPRVTELVEQRLLLENLQEQMATEVGSSIEELQDSAENVAASSEEISEYTQAQVRDLGEVADEIATFSATIEEIASSAEEVNTQSDEARRLAKESQESGQDVLDVTQAVSQAGENVGKSTQALIAKLDEIDQLVEVITDIANQTNLLALNANIEAARADGDGNGFAVVANEIKELAEQSKSEVDEIERIVSEVRESADEVTTHVSTANTHVRDAVEHTESLVENQVAIVDTIQETASGIDEIADATDEQAASAEELAATVDTAVDRAETISAEIEDVAAANEEQTSMVDEISESVARVERRLDAE